MNSTQFLEELSRRLANLSESERKIALDYYSELISDRIEDGMSEAEAIEALGSIDQIVRDAAPELVRIQPAERPVPDSNQMSFYEPVRTIFADCANADVTVLCGPLPAGATAQVEYRLPEGEACICQLLDGQLEVRYSPRHRSFSLWEIFRGANASIRVTLSESALDRGEINTASGDVGLSGLAFEGALSASSSSGSVTFRSVSVQEECSVRTQSGNFNLYTLACGTLQARSSSGSGDVQQARVEGACALQSLSGDMLLVGLQCGGELRVTSTSGDVEARDVFADSISVGSTSGDTALQHVSGRSVSTESTSGDVELDGIEGAESISASSKSGDVSLAGVQDCASVALHSISGDIDLRNVDAQRFELSTVSGDIDGTLAGPAEQYDFRVRSSRGDANVPLSRGERVVEARSISGDIELTAR